MHARTMAGSCRPLVIPSVGNGTCLVRVKRQSRVGPLKLLLGRRQFLPLSLSLCFDPPLQFTTDISRSSVAMSLALAPGDYMPWGGYSVEQLPEDEAQEAPVWGRGQTVCVCGTLQS